MNIDVTFQMKKTFKKQKLRLEVDRDLYREFGEKCQSMAMTKTHAIEEFMRWYLKNDIKVQ